MSLCQHSYQPHMKHAKIFREVRVCRLSSTMLILLKLTPSAALLDDIMHLFTQHLHCKALPECSVSRIPSRLYCKGSRLHLGYPCGHRFL